ncbi:hypothetical protein HJA72_004194 [Vibrio fluvialis]|nr:hypothetical protein [Vibrio fluvialis]
MKTISAIILASLIFGCGGGGEESSSPAASSGVLQSYKAQLSVDAVDLQQLQDVKYASNNGAGFSTPENFKK